MRVSSAAKEQQNTHVTEKQDSALKRPLKKGKKDLKKKKNIWPYQKMYITNTQVSHLHLAPVL